jgi:hypothetical protein
LAASFADLYIQETYDVYWKSYSRFKSIQYNKENVVIDIQSNGQYEYTKIQTIEVPLNIFLSNKEQCIIWIKEQQQIKKEKEEQEEKIRKAAQDKIEIEKAKKILESAGIKIN